MLKISVLCTVLVLAIQASDHSDCRQNWYNHCRSNTDCCSGKCFRGDDDNWMEGVCHPQEHKSQEIVHSIPKSNCSANWNNHCHSNDECCSGVCYMGNSNDWLDGVCQPKNATIQDNCLPKWSNECTESINCCTGYCDKGPTSDWLTGVCRSREVFGAQSKGNECYKNWYNKCQSDSECCSNYCFMGPENQWEHGVCKQRQEIEAIVQQNSTCHPMFFEGCKNNSECCPDLLCDKRAGVNTGTCKPYTALKLLNEDNEWIECFEDWYEFCTEDEHCCSGICHQFDDIKSNFTTSFSYGVCEPDIRIVTVELVQEFLDHHEQNKTNKQNRTRTNQNQRTMRSENRPRRTTRAISVKDKKVICYLGSWANYKDGDGSFVIEDIDPFSCTHLVYGFAKLKHDRITAFDPWLDLSKDEPGGGLDAYSRFTTGLKGKNSALKTLIAIGGWNEGSEKYSKMASTEASRTIFAESVVEFLKKHNFDGLDLDWEYPSKRGGNEANDKDNLSALLRVLRNRLSAAGKMLTMAVSANPRTVSSGYDVPTIVDLVDYISVMSYDYHGAFDNYTGHNAPLYPRQDDLDQTFNVGFGINYWLASGVPPEKLIMGLPLYGRTVQLKDENNNGLLQVAVDAGEMGMYSGEPGFLYYREICPHFENDEWIKKWDPVAMVPYMYKGNQWISYDNEQSLALKVNAAMEANLGGVMFWSLEGDDFRNECNRGENSLLESAKKAMSFDEEDHDCSESGVDAVPVLSQIKSLWEWANGKSHCAKRTQEGFVRKAPIISQITSAVQAISGDEEAARQTQITFLKNVENQIDGVPIIGHVKAAVHCVIGQMEKCKEVSLSATRPVFVLAGGAAGAALGPAGSVAGGLAGGTLFDGLVTAAQSVDNKKYSPSGNLLSVEKVFSGKANPSEVFDSFVSWVGDGLAGAAGGKLAKSGKKPGIKTPKNSKTKHVNVPSCRRRRAVGGGCRFFNDLEDFKPDPRKRITQTTDDGPIKRYQLGHNDRVEYSEAHITREHIQIKEGRRFIQRGTGSGTDKDTIKYSKTMNGPIPKGFEKNDAGHIIGNQLGGTGGENYNIVPQSSHFNRGAWLKSVETLVHNEVKRNGEAKFTVKPIYDSPESTRPDRIHYQIESGGQTLRGDIANPLIKNSDKTDLNKIGRVKYEGSLDDIEENHNNQRYEDISHQRTYYTEDDGVKRRRLEDGGWFVTPRPTGIEGAFSRLNI